MSGSSYHLAAQVEVVRDEIGDGLAGASCHAHLCNAFMTVPRWHHARREELGRKRGRRIFKVRCRAPIQFAERAMGLSSARKYQL
jgi:hypothetical protein